MKLRTAVVALAALGGLTLATGSAFAMPNGIPQASQIAGQTSNIEQARWVCNFRGHCWWRPNWRNAYGFYGGPRWHRWHHWHHWRRW